jgi:FtsH-binding integral membrane protein
MHVLRLILSELYGMFVDDEFLALSILGVVIAAAIVATMFHPSSVGPGLVLVIGCVGVLMSSVVQGARKL